MGKKKSTTTQTVRPIYAPQLEGGGRNIQDAYEQSRPNINAVSNNMAGFSNDVFAAMRNDGNAPASANRFLVSQLEGDPTENPYLDRVVERTGNSLRNQLQARLARAGASGGSDYTNILARALSGNELDMRYADYNNAMNRRMQAAGMSALPVSTAAQMGQAGAMLPNQAAALQGASLGGLLGQYTNSNSRTVQSGGLLGSILSGALQAGMGRIM